MAPLGPLLKRTNEQTNESPPVFYRTSSPSGPLPKRYDLGSERPDMGSKRSDVRSERPDLGSDRPDLGSERSDQGS